MTLERDFLLPRSGAGTPVGSSNVSNEGKRIASIRAPVEVPVRAFLCPALLLIGLATVAPGAPPASAGPVPSLFPLVTGAVWVRKDDDGTEATTRVVGPKTVGSTRCVVTERKAVERGRERVDRSCFSLTAVEVVVIEITTLRGELAVLNPPRPVMKMPPRAGQAWSWSPADSLLELKITSKWVGEETVKTPAGTYKAWKLQAVTTGENSEITTFAWYAPGVGAVRSERKGHRGDRQISGWTELISYKAP